MSDNDSGIWALIILLAWSVVVAVAQTLAGRG